MVNHGRVFMMGTAEIRTLHVAGGQEPVPEAPGTSLDDLVEPALTGDPNATRRLLRGVAPSVRRTISGILGATHADVEDTIQDSFLAFLQALPSYRFECNVVHYAVRIAFRAAIASKRRSVTWRDRFRLSGKIDDTRESETSSPSEEAISAQRRKALERVLAKLPPAQAEVLVLWIVLEFSTAEIAGICGVSLNTVKSRIRLGKDALHFYVERDAVLKAAWEGFS